MIVEGLRLMAIGMTTVFAFLLLMVMVIGAASRLLGRYAHLFPEASLSAPPVAKTGEDLSEIAAVLAAVERFRREDRA